MLKAQQQTVDINAVLALIKQPEQLTDYVATQKISHHTEIVEFAQRDAVLFKSYQQFLTQIQQAVGKVSDSLNKQFHDLLW
jgi:hypothetical protein